MLIGLKGRHDRMIGTLCRKSCTAIGMGRLDAGQSRTPATWSGDTSTRRTVFSESSARQALVGQRCAGRCGVRIAVIRFCPSMAVGGICLPMPHLCRGQAGQRSRVWAQSDRVVVVCWRRGLPQAGRCAVPMRRQRAAPFPEGRSHRWPPDRAPWHDDNRQCALLASADQDTQSIPKHRRPGNYCGHLETGKLA